MNEFVVLLRGINVGGHHKVKMAQLREELGDAGFAKPRTYIQSGNIVVSAPFVDGIVGSPEEAVAQKVRVLFETHYAFVPSIMVVSAERLREIADQNPYKDEALLEPKFVHAYFLAHAPSEEAAEALFAVETNGDGCVLKNDVLYLHSPNGLSKSALAKVAERRLKVPATARNWRTVTKLLEMLSPSA